MILFIVLLQKIVFILIVYFFLYIFINFRGNKHTFLILIKVFLPGHFPNKINLINRQDPIPTAL